MLKLKDRNEMYSRIFHLEESSHKISIYLQRLNKYNFRIEKTSPNHMIKINVTSNGKYWYLVPLGGRQ